MVEVLAQPDEGVGDEQHADAAMRKVSGTARPAVVALACGLMFAAMLGAISATDRPTAAHTDSERLSPGALAGTGSISSSFYRFVPHKCPSGPDDTEGAKGTKQ
jgi:hypothetical protein